jgi:mRNA interferase HigB
MRIFSKGTLRRFWELYPDARPSLEFWYETMQKNNFKNPMELLATFNRADVIGKGRVVFDIAGNKYRLVAKIQYEIQFVYIRFIGTHPEYDEIKDIANI